MENDEDKIQIDDIPKEKQKNTETSEETKISIQDFFTELDILFNKIFEDKNSHQVAINLFKNKFNSFNINNYVKFRECIDFHDSDNYETKLITIIFDIFTKFKNNNQESFFYSCCLQMLEILWNCYLINNFCSKFDDNLKLIDKNLHNLINSKPKANSYSNQLKDLFLLLGNNDLSTKFLYFTTSDNTNLPEIKHNINRFLNELIIKIIENNEDREFMITLNLLVYSKNKSTYLSFKIILLYLQSFIKLNYDIKFFDCVTLNIALLLKEEGTLLSSKINDERFNFQFSDFDYGNPTSSRKLTSDEASFLKMTLFGFIILIFEILHFNDNSFNETIFFNLNCHSVHLELNTILEDY